MSLSFLLEAIQKLRIDNQKYIQIINFKKYKEMILDDH